MAVKGADKCFAEGEDVREVLGLHEATFAGMTFACGRVVWFSGEFRLQDKSADGTEEHRLRHAVSEGKRTQQCSHGLIHVLLRDRFSR